MPLGGSFVDNFRLRSCRNPKLYCDVQLFGKLPFSHVYINSVLAASSGLGEGEEVILEKIENTTHCTHVEVCPLSENDYSIILESHSTIENEFLNQVRLVSKNMILPYFVSRGIHVQLRIVSVTPPTPHPVLLNEDSELHVQTAEVVSTTGKVFENQISKVIDSLSTDAFTSKYVMEGEQTVLETRILPRKIVEAWIKNQVSLIQPSTIYCIGKENTVAPEFGVVEINADQNEEEPPNFAYLYRTPTRQIRRSDSFNSALLRLFQSLQLGDKIQSIDGGLNLEEYTTVELTSLPASYVREAKSVIVTIDSKTYDWMRRFAANEKIIKSLKAKTTVHPLLLSYAGKTVEIPLGGSAVKVHVRPSKSDFKFSNYKRACFLVQENCEVIIKEEIESKSKDPSSEKIREKERKQELTDPQENYGLQSKIKLVHIGGHSQHLHDIVSLLEHQERVHCLILGGKGYGKTSLLKRLARRLAHNSMVFYSQRLDCAQLKGKSAENVEKKLSATLGKLSQKSPSVLIMDDLDSFLPFFDLEQRQIHVEKVVAGLLRSRSFFSI
ncbi:unnamed protein product [Caenorhabditis auriculariae]|uniref:Peroxin-1 n=1 Tax=Caenorhabditis auriculariae TaxID=2777116 RepID=A0A8S1GUG2_9PELO|nr:unnamed protein product [Caenorhabditis auriculariae]